MPQFLKNIFRKSNGKKTIQIKINLDNGDVYEECIKLQDFDERITFLQEHFHQAKSLDQIEYVHCLIGNIKADMKHFSCRVKVYCYPPTWGDGYEKIKVIGRHRGSSRLVTMVIRSSCVINWRYKKVFDRFVIKEMTNNFGWTDKECDMIKVTQLANDLKTRNS
jgi:hypothetical protein